MTGVAVATAAIVIVLSVFNGFSRLSEEQISRVDPELKLVPKSGKTFAGADSLAQIIAALPGIAAAQPVIEDRAMIMSDYAQVPVVFKAVAEDYDRIVELESVMLDGVMASRLDSMSCIQLSVGVANRTGLRPGVESRAELYVPRRKGRINPANPESSFKGCTMIVSGIIQADQSDVDNDRVIIPLDVARQMLDYSDEASAIEIAVMPGNDISSKREVVAESVGPDFVVLDRKMQQAEAFRMIKIEKWVTFMMLIFILLIATFNIVSALSLLVIEKLPDTAIFRAVGLTRRAMRNVFAWQGMIITLIGGLSGTVLGIILTLVQQYFGIIKLAGDPSALTITEYPVRLEFSDIVAVIAVLILTSVVISALSRVFTKNIK